MKNAELYITDGTAENTISLLQSGTGFGIVEYNPNVTTPKGGGAWSDSPFASGRVPFYSIEDDVTDNLTIGITGANQEELISHLRELRRVLRLAVEYWQSPELPPVYLKRRAACETYYTYSVIKAWSTPNDPDFFGAGFNSLRPVDPDFSLTIVRGNWTKNPPGTAECAPIDTRRDVFELGTANLVSNPGFETAGGGGADVFGSWLELAGPGTIARDTVDFRTGVASCKQTSGGATRSYVYQNYTVVASDLYRFSFWYKTAATTCRIIILDVTNTVNIYISLLPAAAAWTQYTVNFQIPANCASVRISLQSSATAGEVINYDDVELYVRSETTAGVLSTCPNNYLVNPGFELMTATNNFASWNESAGSGTIARDTVNFHSGIASVALTGWVTGSARIYTRLLYGKTGQKYRFSFWHRNTVSAGSFSIYDEERASYVIQSESIPVSAGWSYREYMISVPDDGTGYKPFTFTISFYSPAAAQTINIDDVSFAPAEPLAPAFEDHLFSAGFLLNGYAPSELTHIFTYDGATWSANLVNTTPPFPLIRVNGGAVETYFGSSTGFASSLNRPFAIAAKMVGNGDISPTMKFQYWTGAAWADFTNSFGTFVAEGSSNIDDFPYTRDGYTIGHLLPEATTAAVAVNGVTAFWVRMIATAIPTNGDSYAVDIVPFYPNRPIMKIPAINSDLPVSAELLLETYYGVNRYMIATRSVRRGADFMPVIPFAQKSLPAGVLVSVLGVMTYTSDYRSPYFETLTWAVVGSGPNSSDFVMNISNPLANQYRGRFRVFIRAEQTAGALNDVYYTMRIGTITYTSTRHYSAGANLLDFGVVTLPGADTAGEYVYSIDLNFTVYRTGAGQVKVFDLIFMPVDEQYFEATVDSPFVFSGPARGKISGIDPRYTVRGLIVNNASGSAYRFPYGPVQVILPGALTLPPNEDTFLIALVKNAYPWDVLTQVSIFVNPQYYGARGGL